MNAKKLAILIVMSLIGLGAVLFIISSESSGNSDEADKTQSNAQSSVQDVENQDSSDNISDSAKKYEISEVATHNSEQDCWTIINNSVYDITNYIPRHVGGDEILRACGIDSTTMFESRQTESGEIIGSGEAHSSNAERQLEPLKIGVLAQ